MLSIFQLMRLAIATAQFLMTLWIIKNAVNLTIILPVMAAYIIYTLF